MIKICFVTTVSLTLKAFVLDLAEYLHSTGNFDVSFACKNDPEFAVSLPDYIHYYPITIERGANATVFSAPAELRRLFEREKFDVVQFSTPNASYCASKAARKAKIPVRLYCQWGIVYVGFTGLKRMIFKHIEKSTCRNATIIEPDSYGNLEFSVKEGLYLANKAHVVGRGSAAGVDLKKFDRSQKEEYRKQIRRHLQIPEGNLVFGFVGRLDPDKGINELLEAYRDIHSANMHLLIIGPDDKKDTLNQDLYQWSLQEKSIIYTGSTQDVPKYLSAMDIFVLPSYREGFGSVVIEAEAMELPVIVTDIPGPTEAMEKDKTGIVIPKADKQALKLAMIKSAENEDLRKDFGKAGYQYVSTNFEKQHLFKLIAQDREKLVKNAFNIRNN